MKTTFHKFQRDESGAAMVEFTLIFFLLIGTTFAVVDIGYALWQWSSAEKATQLAVRHAIVSNPVADGLENFDCNNINVVLGTGCDDVNATTSGGWSARAPRFPVPAAMTIRPLRRTGSWTAFSWCIRVYRRPT